MEEKDIKIQQHAKLISDGVTKVDEMRLDGYAGAIHLRNVKDNARRNERNRLAAKYGEDHPRVTGADQSMAQGANFVKATRSQQDRTANAVPNVKPGTWLMQGVISDRKGAFQDDLTVSFFNKAGKWERELGHTCSDPNGVFVLRVDDPQVIARFKDVPVFLTVSNREQRVLYRDFQPTMIVSGGSVVRQILVDDPNCLPPESEATTEAPAAAVPVADKENVIWGFVSNPHRQALRGVTVKAIANTPDGDCDLGAVAKTDSAGRYKIVYTNADFNGDGILRPDVTLHIYDEQGKKIHHTESHRSLPSTARVDVSMRKKWFFF